MRGFSLIDGLVPAKTSRAGSAGWGPGARSGVGDLGEAGRKEDLSGADIFHSLSFPFLQTCRLSNFLFSDV
jgi:hypothetical protein